jgi:hypothetical protein
MIDLRELEEAIKLVVSYKLESLTLPNGIIITKKIHLGDPLPKKEKKEEIINDGLTEEQIMFHSAGASRAKIGVDGFNRLTTNPKLR